MSHKTKRFVILSFLLTSGMLLALVLGYAWGINGLHAYSHISYIALVVILFIFIYILVFFIGLWESRTTEKIIDLSVNPSA
ncbi:hypothetical protein [Caldalkalibacillus mannanilyticus]|uniref:hypothetical protein n=1 Tax=Caldalkalibacillus mannanilyticus TaxID=1418 RepID=UPI00046AFA9C|nr:hypothetical protein [Caldalkalibacillus mannanilyticus]